MERLARTQMTEIPLLRTEPVKKVLVILLTSNKGLCGSFNANIYKKMASLLRDLPLLARHRMPMGEEVVPVHEVSVDVIGVGKKSAWICKKLGLNLLSVFDGLKEKPEFEDVAFIGRLAIKDFVEKKYQKVVVVYTDYKSSLAQVPKVRQILPISEKDLEKMNEEMGSVAARKGFVDMEASLEIDKYMFEPDMAHILSTVLPRLAEMQLFQAVLESAASEHSARMVAMKNATESAKEMLVDLRLTYNKARQAAITQEISEIVGGAAALG
jgi:F-type H+-transporting ATPase subunit gamma